jgi:fermentation-respiration switch protein FrsA (DUF1100 family)
MRGRRDAPAPGRGLRARTRGPKGEVGEDASARLRRSTSLDSLVTPASPPFFIWHAAEDPYVPPEHTYRLASALAASHA